MDAKAQIRAILKIEDIIGRTVELKRHGNYLTGFCPFHDNTNTPAFVVWPSSQTWRCFGACGEGGDLFSFVMKRDGLTFEEALESLAGAANLSKNDHRPPTADCRTSPSNIQHPTSKIRNRLTADRQPRQADWQGSLLSLCDHFAANLFATAGEDAHSWLNRRGLADTTLQRFRVGFNPISQRYGPHYVYGGITIPHYHRAVQTLWGVKIRLSKRGSLPGCSIGSTAIQASPYLRNYPNTLASRALNRACLTWMICRQPPSSSAKGSLM